jgi:hypothetical protein
VHLPASLVAATAVLAIASTGAFASPGWAASTVTVAFPYTGATQEWVVPHGVTSVTLDAFGAEGSFSGVGAHVSGLGAHAHGTVPVTAGETLLVVVGGEVGVGNGPALADSTEVATEKVVAAAGEAPLTCARGPTSDWPNA